MLMLSVLKEIRRKYDFDSYAILLFVVVSLSIKSLYEYLIPILLVLTVVQIIRGLTNRVSKQYLFNTYFCLLIYSTVFYKSVQTIVLISLLIILILYYIKEKPHKQLNGIRTEIIMIIFFGAIAINLIIFEPHFKGIDKYLYLLLLPIIFLLSKKMSFEINKFTTMKIHIASVLCSSILLLMLNLIESSITLETNTYFAKYLDLTHVYYGMFIGSAGVFLLILYKEGNYFISKKHTVFIFLWFLAILIFIGARISFFALLSILLVILFVIVKLPLLKKSLLLVVIGVSFFAFIYNTMPRFSDDIKYVQNVYLSIKTNNKQDIIHNSWRNMYQRFLVSKYAIKEISEKPLFGIGLQNVKKTLSDKIIKEGYIYFEPLNTHNQFLEVWVGMGVFLFLYFVWMLVNFYKLQSYSLYFISFFIILMLTEAILVRIKGISLFFLFSLIFSYKGSNN